jgi:carbohydrate-selective porin OprB
LPIWRAARSNAAMSSGRVVALILALLTGLVGPRLGLAQAPAPETYAGNAWDRPRLTGDWAGYRDQAAKRGITLDVDWLQTLQGVMSGGVNQDASYWGTFEYTLNLDTGKLGLWPAGFVTAYAISSYGTSAVKDSGALARPSGPIPGRRPRRTTRRRSGSPGPSRGCRWTRAASRSRTRPRSSGR